MKRKGRKESDVEAISTPWQNKKRKNDKECYRDQITTLSEKVDQIGNCLNELTEIDKNSEICSKEKETPAVEYKCLFESEASYMKNRSTIFVEGFDCSFPMDEIKTTLINHFTSCGEVTQVYLPYECKTGSPLGFGFINMDRYPDKALALDGTMLGGMRLEVTMAIKKSVYYGYTSNILRGCERCGPALKKLRWNRFIKENTIIRLPLGSPKQDEEAITN
ncbi:hypothetical protein AALP_AA7G261200 [Arabis alpina]|uniref:RRM domain-containing protein n=1 Tax=Arabis alpina TaxID=50452 RepID=A0A087GKN7_ARAAL|nr:hypothetical protein AALP_AA7G261200 [Arabis alpina]